MIAAHQPIQRPPMAKLLMVSEDGWIGHGPRSRLVELLRTGDLMIANDAATMPASLSGEHLRSGRRVEVRLAGRRSLAPEAIRHCAAVVFGAGDYRQRTEDRPMPPVLRRGDHLQLGPLRATVDRLLQHPRLAQLEFHGSTAAIWEGIARHGRPIQYAHILTPLDLWDVWTPIAGAPAAFEAPSAGFALHWDFLKSLKERGVRFATLTHAAGISSTGDAALDAILPLDEPYNIPLSTALAVNRAKQRGDRVVAVGTTVVRALEHAAAFDGSVRAGPGLASQRIDGSSRLRVVDALLSGTHEPGTSHYELLRAFTDDDILGRMDHELNTHCYRTHEFGDSVFLERMARLARVVPAIPMALRVETKWNASGRQ
jgi:S-adenosylmethionine:tRNA ribosyltransferase-isomerase